MFNTEGMTTQDRLHELEMLAKGGATHYNARDILVLCDYVRTQNRLLAMQMLAQHDDVTGYACNGPEDY